MMAPLSIGGYGPSIGFLFILQKLSPILVVAGVIMLVAWAVKHLSGPKLKSLGLWLLGVGIAGCLLAALLVASGMGGDKGKMMKGGSMPINGMMRLK